PPVRRTNPIRPGRRSTPSRAPRPHLRSNAEARWGRIERAPPTTRIREFTAADIPRVADIHRRAFEVAPAMTPQLADEYRQWVTTVFLEAPTRAPGRRESLVYEDGDDVIGFFGVVARTVELNGRQY